VTAQEADAALAEMDQRAADLNAALELAAAGEDRVHVVDMEAVVTQLRTSGLMVGDTTLDMWPFGGLVSLDGVHFTDMGDAMVANAFIDAVNTTLGTAVPQAELAALLDQDPGAPAVMAAAGLDACE